MMKEGEWDTTGKFSELKKDLLNKLSIDYSGELIKEVHQNINSNDGSKLIELIKDMHQCINNDSILIELIKEMRSNNLVELVKEVHQNACNKK